MKCAVKACGFEFEAPSNDLPGREGSCPQCHSVYWFREDGSLAGPEKSWFACHVCGDGFEYAAAAKFLDGKKMYELHSCRGSRPCEEPRCIRTATKLVMVFVPSGLGMGFLIGKPGGDAFCDEHAAAVDAKSKAKLIPQVAGWDLRHDQAEKAVHEIDLYKAGGRFAEL